MRTAKKPKKTFARTDLPLKLSLHCKLERPPHREAKTFRLEGQILEAGMECKLDKFHAGVKQLPSLHANTPKRLFQNRYLSDSIPEIYYGSSTTDCLSLTLITNPSHINPWARGYNTRASIQIAHDQPIEKL